MVGGPLAVVASLLAPAWGSAAACDSTSPTIDTVIIENAGAADGALGNALHVRTRATVIRRAILLAPGDCYDAARAAESERALWRLGVFRAVRVDTVRTSATGRFALRVTTADGWSLRPVTDYARTGAQTTWEVGFLEQNLLGTASQLFFSYRSTPDRGALAAHYYDPDAVLRGATLYARHAELSNGRQSSWAAGLPFREPASRWSLLVDGDAGDERVLAFGERTTITEASARALRLRVTGGWAVRASTAGYTRFWIGARWRREGWSPSPGAPYSLGTFLAAGSGVELARVRYHTARNVNTYGRPEWVDLSQVARLGVWAAPRAWGYAAERAGVGAEARWQAAVAAPRGRGHAVLRADAAGAWARGALDSAHVRARLTIVAQPAGWGRHTLVAHGDAGLMLGRRPPGFYDLWLEQRGPRLFPPHAFMAPRLWWIAVEHRVLVVESLAGQLGLGVAPFADYADAGGVAGGDAGLALRVAPLRMAASDVTEIAVGYRFGAEPGRWAVGLRKAVVF
jgi:hypothetical protein